MKIIWWFLVWVFLITFLQMAGIESSLSALLAAVITTTYFVIRGIYSKKRKKQESKTKNKELPEGVIYSLEGVNDVLEAYENKVTITPKTNTASIIVRGLKGSKSIPYASITAIQFRKANPANGYIQFSLMGAIESGGGVINAISDENTCFFTEKDNDLAEKIRDYIEEKMQELKIPNTSKSSVVSLSDEIQKLAKLKDDGLMTEEEINELFHRIRRRGEVEKVMDIAKT